MPKNVMPLAVFLRRRRWRRRAVFGFVAVLGILLILADRGGWLLYRQGGDLARYDGQTFRVTRVIDGDTLEIAAADADQPVTRIRLWGIDTPETAKPWQGRPAEPWAVEASDLARQLAEDCWVRLELEPHRIRDDFGRLLAFVELPDGTLLNEALLAAGLTPADDRWHHRYLERFDLLELQAKKDRVGLWGGGRNDKVAR